jgi:citrate lyase subunit beta / citryl-CoA lyase
METIDMDAPIVARSLLFVPGNRPERFAKAIGSGADAVIIDLEDAVATDDKPAARDACRDFLADGGAALVRINGMNTDWAGDDIALCGVPGVAGVILPKAERAEDIASLRSRLRIETPILPLIETVTGMLNAMQIASAPGVSRLLFGTVDFCLDAGIEGDADELSYHRAMLVLASRGAGIHAPVDGVTLDIRDIDELERAAMRARRGGFGGKLCIHPAQVSRVNACFSPSAADIEWASQIVQRAGSSRGAFSFEGKMVDAPVIERANRILQRAIR